MYGGKGPQIVQFCNETNLWVSVPCGTGQIHNGIEMSEVICTVRAHVCVEKSGLMF